MVEDIKAIDIMNYPGEAGFYEYMFKWEEFKTMARTTFKSIWGGRVPTEEEVKAVTMFIGHASLEELIKDMDELGYDKIVITDIKMWSYRSHFQVIVEQGIDVVNDIVQKAKGRVIGGVSYNPFRIEESLRDIDKAVKEYGFKYGYFHPITFGLQPNDKKCYPFYAKCNELSIPCGLQVGHSAEPLPSWVGHPIYIDEVVLDFPKLKINLSHTGYPWVDEWCSMLFKHENVYGDIAAYMPRNLESATIRFMSGGRGRDKVLFGTNGFGLKTCKEQLLSLDISDKSKQRILRDNAMEFLGL